MLSFVGAAVFAILSSSGNRAVAAEVQATAQLSTGLVQGSKLTLATYEFEGSEKYVLATGGPYFADDTFPLLVDEQGEVVLLSTGSEIVLAAIIGFLIVAMLSVLVYFIIVIAFDP